MIIPADLRVSELKILNYFNSIDPKITFTMETEKMAALIFLTLLYIEKII